MCSQPQLVRGWNRKVTWAQEFKDSLPLSLTSFLYLSSSLWDRYKHTHTRMYVYMYITKLNHLMKSFELNTICIQYFVNLALTPYLSNRDLLVRIMFYLCQPEADKYLFSCNFNSLHPSAYLMWTQLQRKKSIVMLVRVGRLIPVSFLRYRGLSSPVFSASTISWSMKICESWLFP